MVCKNNKEDSCLNGFRRLKQSLVPSGVSPPWNTTLHVVQVCEICVCVSFVTLISPVSINIKYSDKPLSLTWAVCILSVIKDPKWIWWMTTCKRSSALPPPRCCFLSTVPHSPSWTTMRFPLLSHSPCNLQWGLIGGTWRKHESRASQTKNIWLQFVPKGRDKGNKQLRAEGAQSSNTTTRARYNFPCRTKQLCQWATWKYEEQTVASLLHDGDSSRVSVCMKKRRSI